MEAFMPESLGANVFKAARDGMIDTLQDLLADRSPQELASTLSCQTEPGTGTTPFFIAVAEGKEEVIRLFLTHYTTYIDIEQEGNLDPRLYEPGFHIFARPVGVTALWLAARNGHLDLVTALLEFGANINHPNSCTNSTPLSAACTGGHLHVVNCLLQLNADMEIQDKCKGTCLMIACYKGYTGVVACLLEHGADPDIIWWNVEGVTAEECPWVWLANENHDEHIGNRLTALHIAAGLGLLEIVQILCQFNALISVDNLEYSPIRMAMVNDQTGIIQYFATSESRCSPMERVEALELLGASLVLHEDDAPDYDQARFYMQLAMEVRLKDPENPVHKNVNPFVEAYGRGECQTLAEYDVFRDWKDIAVEALLIRERIFGEDHWLVVDSIKQLGCLLAKRKQFDQAIKVLVRGLKLQQLQQKIGSIMDETFQFLCELAHVFTTMSQTGVKIDLRLVKNVLELALLELETHLKVAEEKKEKRFQIAQKQEESFHVAEEKQDERVQVSVQNKEENFQVAVEKQVVDEEHAWFWRKQDSEREEQMLKVAGRTIFVLYILDIAIKSHPTPEDDFNLGTFVYRLNKLNIRLEKNIVLPYVDGYTPLHIVLDEIISFSSYILMNGAVLECPNVCMAKLLVHCGSDVNSVDYAGNTPLHIIASYSESVSDCDFSTVQDIVMTLIEAGAEMDIRNKKAKTPMQCAELALVADFLYRQKKISLRHICAKAVRKYELQYRGHLGPTLEQYVDNTVCY